MAPHLASLLLAGLALLATVADAGKPHVSHGKFKAGPWTVGHATFYGGRDGSGTTDGGACGYKDALAKDYGVLTAAVSPELYDSGAGCGACYEVVACVKQGGIRYTITGNKNYNMVMVTNVGGEGDVVALMVKGNKRVKWTPMKRSWGQLWTTEVDLTGESLTFRVMNGDHRKATSWHVMPRDWQFGKTYQATKNF
ncbi:hypothetical protein HU200_034192 [Digitaria exilis]|uniref:Expansin n=1 Tax=Digitaria exilis TaxID=1010633 RepID=A0A835BLG4_9POAL|nr:hypothetical protein HU200_034192 [Digitaria exilis]